MYNTFNYLEFKNNATEITAKFVNKDQLCAYLDEGKVYNYNQIKEDEYMADIE